MKPDIRIFKDLETLSRHAAEIFVEQSAKAISEHDRFLVVLNGGNTPNRLFQLLATEYRDKVDWNSVHIFWGDERCVPPTDPGNSYGQAKEILLDYVHIPENHVHRVRGELAPTAAALEYSEMLKKFAESELAFPHFDLVYLGMGEDGHTASLFPGAPVKMTETVVPVTANYQDRPANRVTLTPRIFNQARMIVFMAIGEKKANTLAEVIGDRYNPELYPVQRIEPKDGELIWLVDNGAASKLPRKTKGLKFCEG
jgi:6-phosphogluconolactonase